jgi:hypothetical protein
VNSDRERSIRSACSWLADLELTPEAAAAAVGTFRPERPERAALHWLEDLNASATEVADGVAAAHERKRRAAEIDAERKRRTAELDAMIDAVLARGPS